MNINSKVTRLTETDKHHFFGFHDLEISNKKNDRLLTLQVDEINHPPRDGEVAKVGFVDLENLKFIPVAETIAWNYPQGARQQWIGSSNTFIVNDRVNDDWGSCVYDTDTLKKLEEYSKPSHVINNKLGLSFSVNYSRLHRLGAYGYTGLNDIYSEESAPEKDGIFVLNLNTKETSLILSLSEIASFKIKPTKRHHYITHLTLSPSGERLAFLHRYRLSDGGEMTRLMTIGIDGSDLRCLLFGFLSHFDWKDDETLIMWGRSNQSVANLRENKLLKNPVSAKLMKYIKPPLQKLLNRSSVMNKNFMFVKDNDHNEVKKFAEGIITSDGHPMVNPINRDWMISDTYPNAEGFRTLMLYQFSNNRRIDIDTYKMLDTLPTKEIIEEFSTTIDPILRDVFPAEQYAFTRSGLHCDLHPRWLSNGKAVAFDSIHEGTRQLYMADVEDYLGN